MLVVGDVAAVDRELFALARGRGRLALRLGEALLRLEELGGHQALGFSTLASWSLERCSRTGRWAAETRALAKRLSLLPEMRGAFERGELSLSMVELLSRHATAGDERELLEATAGMTVRQVRAVLREKGEQLEEETEPMRTVTITVPTEEAWALEATRMLVEHMDGRGKASDFVESLLAEGQTSLIHVLEQMGVTADVLPEHLQRAHERWLEERRRLDELRERVEERAEGRLAPNAREPGRAPAAEDETWDLYEAERRVRRLCAEAASRDLWLGEMLGRFFAVRGYETLGHASEGQYCRERLGMGRATAWRRIDLTRAGRRLDAVAEAVRSGRIGLEAARLIARVAGEQSQGAWVERAGRRTYKHLQQEVQMVETLARLESVPMLPPSDAEVSQFEALERDVLSGAMFRGPSGTEREGAKSGGDEQVSMSGSGSVGGGVAKENRARGRVTVRLRVRAEVALQLRQLDAVYQAQLGDSGLSFAAFLCASFWATWVGSLGKSDKYELVYRANVYRCSCPVCVRRDVTAHHVVYRSHGGGEEPGNLTSPCAFCHLLAIHAGLMSVRGTAPDRLLWLIGRRPLIAVEGREKREVA